MSSADDGGWGDPGTNGSRDQCLRIQREGVPLTGTAGVEYLLKERGLQEPLWDQLTWLPNARTGEGAVCMPLTVGARLVGFAIEYIDAFGKRSVVEPARQTLKLEERKSPDAVFDFPTRGDGDGVTVICDGCWDAHTVWTFGRPRSHILGTPGVFAVKHFKFPASAKILIVPDGDAEGSEGRKWLVQGIDSLLLQGCDVLVAEIPPHRVPKLDANEICRESGVDGLRNWLDAARSGELSDDGELRRLTTLDALAYGRTRAAMAKKLGVTLQILDQAVEEMRRRVVAEQKEERERERLAQLNAEPDTPLAEILDGILAQTKRYIVAPEYLLGVVALWSAFTHLVHHERIQVRVAPRLGIQAKTYGCGKTVLLEIILNLVHNPKAASSITASTVLRSVGLTRPTLVLDEAHLLFRRDRSDELFQVCNSSHRRTFAFVERSVPMRDGSWVVERFDVWHTAALAGVGELPRDQQERSIVIRLQKALAHTIPEQLEDGTSDELQDLQHKLMIWAHRLDELDRPQRPAILDHQPGRVFDNWRPLIAIADLAGGNWPGLIETAIAAEVGVERRLDLTERLLVSIRKIFNKPIIDPTTQQETTLDRIETSALVAALNSDPEEDWNRINHGSGVSEYWLRSNLVGLVNPPKSQRWRPESNDPNLMKNKRRGYFRSQFETAWSVHLSDVPDDDVDAKGEDLSGPSGPSVPFQQNQQRNAADDPAHDEIDPAQDGVSPYTAEGMSHPSVAASPRR